MTAALDRATAALGNANVRAFLQVIREGESSHDETAYTVINGGEHFQVPPWVHPYAGQSAPPGRAAGAYQFIPHTWDACAKALGLDSFDPASQDVAAVHLIAGREALADVMAGNLVAACAKLKDEWVSLPGLGLDRVQRVFLAHGGTYGAAAPEVVPQAAPAPSPEVPMPILALLPIIAQLLPGLISAFGKNSDRAMQNAASAQAIADALVKVVPGATGPGDVVDKLAAATKEERAQITAAVLADPIVATLVEIGGGPAAARIANTQLVAAADKWWKIVLNPVLLVTALLIPLVYYIAYKLGPVIPSVSPDVIAQTIGTIIGMVLGSVTGFWMGMTYQQTGNNRRQSDAQPGAGG